MTLGGVVRIRLLSDAGVGLATVYYWCKCATAFNAAHAEMNLLLNLQVDEHLDILQP
jgi:hypothetical protein